MKVTKYLSVFLLIVFFLAEAMSAKGVEGERRSGQAALRKADGSPVYTHFNINQISTWIKNNGETDINPNGNSGFEYPKGGNKQAVFQSGLVWGAEVDGEKRVGGSTYRQGLLPGAVDLTSSTKREDDGADHVRMYKVRPDWETGNVNSEVADGEGTESEVRAQYQKDWNEWPATYGAPYTDVDANGSYDPTVDIPGIPGADQTVWFVANDMDDAQALFIYGAHTIGLEMQATVWGYNLAGALGSMMFRKFLFINYSGKDLKNCYVAMWSDPDVGGAGDDFVGCDTLLSLSYCYNGAPSDAQYGSTPPAVGFDFFQGPWIAGAATDTSIWNLKKRPGRKNLGMTAHFFFINGDAVYNDPDLGDYQNGTLQMYNLFEGKVSTTGVPFTDPNTGNETAFALAGDPVTGTGWIDGILHPPGDRRLGLASGPFEMAAGDSQEVVVAEMAAISSDNLAAVSRVKAFDQVAQSAYNDLFVLPSPPKAPAMKASGLDQEVILNWGWDVETANATETHSKKGFVFEGYNVYQLPSPQSSFDDAKNIGTFDLVNTIKNITGEEVDPNTGATVNVVQQSGTDAGVQRYIRLTRDAISNQRFFNGSKYYFAVTAYAYNPDPLAVPNNLESPLNVVEVIPQAPDPGTRLNASVGDAVDVTHSAGFSDGIITVSVVDPSVVTGHDYKVTFNNDLSWNVIDVTTGDTLAAAQTNQEDNQQYPVVDGLMVKVSGPSLNFKDFVVTENANGPIDGFAGASADYRGFPGLGRANGGNQQANGEFWFVDYSHSSGDAGHYDDFLNRTTQYSGGYGEADMGILSIIPDDFEFRFTAAGAKGYFNWNYDPTTSADAAFVGDVPFEMWNIKVASDATDDFQMFPFVLDNENDGAFNLRAVDSEISSADNDPTTDLLYTIEPLDDTPGTAGYDAMIAKYTAAAPAYEWGWAFLEADSKPSLMRFGWTNWNGGDVTDTTFPANVVGTMPEVGTVFRIVTNKINQPNDEFSFSAPTVEASKDLAVADVEKINVFPNPYYGFNTQEINKYQRFVTFTHLPNNATIRIFNLAGQLVKTINKSSSDQFERWDLANDAGLPAASGLYIAYIELPDLDQTKILKFSIIQEQQVLDRF